MKRYLYGLLALIGVSLSVGTARADITLGPINPVADAVVYSNTTTRNGGAAIHLMAGRVGPNNVDIVDSCETSGGLAGNMCGATRRSALRFNVSSIPAGAVIRSVQVKMTIALAGDAVVGAVRNVSLRRVTTAWSEGTGGGADPPQTHAAIGSLVAGVNWSSLGFLGTNSATVGVSQTVINPATALPFVYTWQGSTMVADVQAWVNGTAGNNGWVMIGNESTTTTMRRFFARTDATVANRPTLTVTYDRPNGASCVSGLDCVSGFCTNGVCCFTSSCGVASECQTSNPVCLGNTCSNPAKVNGTACTPDANPCSQDVCTNGSCTHNLPASSAVQCRAASGGVCDAAENCNGVNTTCPANGYLSGTVCRAAAAGGCDVAETCPGTGPNCPADAFAPPGTVCRPTAGICDAAETCTGSSVTCPANVFLSSATQCRASAGVCDVAENCSGSSATCPADGFVSSATQCRASGGVCDVAENCTGSSASCPANGFLSAATQCRASAGACDVAESCTGTLAACPADGFASAATVCRGAVGECDQAENCPGSSATCPSDSKKVAGTACTADTNPCTLDRCDGTGNACTHPAGNAGTQCRAPSCSAGIATLAETCTGSSTVCPGPNTVSCAPNTCSGTTCSGGCVTDIDCASTAFCLAGVCQPKKALGQTCGGNTHCTSTFCVDGVCCENACAGGSGDCQACNNSGQLGVCRPRPSNTVCRVAAGECDLQDTCNGTSITCTDVKKTNGTVCTDDLIDCTADICNGTSNLCQHPNKAAGAACAEDGNLCTTDRCDGLGTCTHPPGNSGTECRPASGEPCDVADFCDGVSATCANVRRPAGFACPDDGNECTADQCDGVAETCQHPNKAAGTACTDDSNPCTLDVCQTGTCSHPAGNPGTLCRTAAGVCDVQETCTGTDVACPANAFRPTNAQCRAESCSAGIATAAANCTGTSATCPAVQSQVCSPFICSGTACSASCASDTGCATTAWCNGTLCEPKRPSGTACTAANQCLDDNCVDGVCCNRPCAGQCEACDVVGVVGRCTPVVGPPHGTRPACVGDGSACGGICNGTQTLACFLPGASTQCRPPSCENGVATLEAFCQGNGSCPGETTTDCGQFVCSVSACFGDCTADIHCVSTSYCSGGSCVPKLTLGQGCTGDNQCSSGQCVDGFCCNDRCPGQCEACNVQASEGTCTPVTGIPHAPRLPCVSDGSDCAGACDGSVRSACVYPGAGTSCRSASCENDQAVVQAFCDGAGSCPPEFRQSCTPFGCAGTRCAGDCTTHADCSSTEFCSAGVCAAKRNNGQTCPDGNACKSGICVDGLCCGSACTGQCEACDVEGSLGTCVPVVGAPHGTRPACTGDDTACAGTCDGSLRTGCAYPSVETSCRSGSCAGNVATLAATCNGSGRCPAVQQTSCGTFGCATGRCNGDCTTDANCASGQFCAGGICTSLLIIGRPCSSAAQCLTGVCADGVCCDRACDGQCEACDVTAKVGLCSTLEGGLPHGGRPSCPGVGPCAARCTSASAAQCTFPSSTTICGGSACAGQAVVEPPVCNGAGLCLPPTTAACDPYVCASGACIESCTSNSDCIAGFVCIGSLCERAPPDAGTDAGAADAGPDASAGGAATGGSGGAVTGGSGGSGGSAARDSGGAATAGIDGDAGDAGPRPPAGAPEDDGGCGCRTARSSAGGAALALLALLALAFPLRRRRRARR